MKMSYETKEKMANQRKGRVRAYFNAYGIGSKVYFMLEDNVRNPEWAYVLSYHEYEGDYYYVLGNAQGGIFLGRVVYSGCAGVIKVPKTSNKYLKNKNVFDGWIREVKNKRARDIRDFYDSHLQTYHAKHTTFVNPNEYVAMVGEKGKKDLLRLVLKKEMADKYYFVLERSKNDFVITKLVWSDGYIHAVALSEKELTEHKEEFEIWLYEAKKKGEKKDIYG